MIAAEDDRTAAAGENIIDPPFDQPARLGALRQLKISRVSQRARDPKIHQAFRPRVPR